MSSISISSKVYKRAPRSNVAIIAQEGEHRMGSLRLSSPAGSGGPLPLILILILFLDLDMDMDLDLDHIVDERENVLLYFSTSWSSPGSSQPRTCRLLIVAWDKLKPVRHQCATERWPNATQPHSQALPLVCISDTARQTQVHEINYAIHRLMPQDRTIYFAVDRSSFISDGVPDAVVDVVIASAKEIASRIQRQNLGISFAYRPISDSSTVFDIRYDPSLAPKVGAQSFLPSDPRTEWKLSISESVVTSQCNLYYLPNILAHEFAHILGLRHWHAHTHEVTERSFHWPNTSWNCRESVMVTDVPPWEIMFSEEDFRVIRELYSLPNGHVFAGRQIIDVRP